MRSLLFFHLIDDPNLDRWQSGLIRADGTRRPSYDSVKAAIARTGGRCAGITTAWRHATAVIGPSAKLPVQARRAAAHEDLDDGRDRVRGGDATTRASSASRGGRRRPGRRAHEDPARAPAREADAAPRWRRPARCRPTGRAVVRFPKRTLKPGYYVYAVQLFAETNPTRKSFFVSKAFQVAAAKGRR